MSLSKQIFNVSESIKFECFIFVRINNRGDKEFWFKGHDIATFLGYKRPNTAITDHIKENWKQTWVQLKDTAKHGTLKIPSNWQRHTVFINEAALWKLLAICKLPEADSFQT